MDLESSRRLETAIAALAVATSGDLSVRLQAREDGPSVLLELEFGINALLQELHLAVQEREQQREQLHQQALQIIEQQRSLLAVLSTPAIVVWPQVLVLPILGDLEPERAAEMTETLLAKVVSQRATHVILDLTGATHADRQIVQALMRMAQSIRLLGCRCLMTGIPPALAVAFIKLELNMSEVPALPSLAEALTVVFRERGMVFKRQE